MTVVDEETVRQTGKTAAQEAVEGLRKENEAQVAPELPEERSRAFRTPGLARIRTEWHGEDGITMRRVHAQVEDIIDSTFHDMFAIRQELYQVVRTPEHEPTGEVKTDRYGWMLWQRTSTGNYLEDWGRLTHHQREHFLFQIDTRLFEWEERADRLWAEAMFAKTQWEESFAEGWAEARENGHRTDAAKEEHAKKEAMAERYFAVYATYLSRRGESLVRGMTRLEQRLKDVHTNGR